MNPERIRWIDKNVGKKLCFFLTLHRRFCGIFKKKSSLSIRPSKILFIKLIEQGATVLAYPALKLAKDSVGEKNLYFMVFKENRPILDILNLMPSFNVIEIDSGNFRTFISSLIKALIKIRKEKIDTVVDMEFFSRASAIISYLSGAGKRVGLHRFNCEGPYRGDLFTHKLLYNPYLHTRIFYLSLAEALNHAPPFDNSPMVFKIPKILNSLPVFSPKENDKIDLIKKIEGLKGSGLSRPLILLNPAIGDLLPIRKWPEENFISLGKMILKEFSNATVIITGDSREKEKTDAVGVRIGNAVSLAGKTSIRELLTLYCIADILVTNDSGPSHFSSLTPIKTVILFGPETPFLFGEKNGSRETIAPDLVCSPCVNVYNHRESPCRSGTCLKNTKVEDVYEIVKKMLTG